ncbi:MAG: apolipoprotein N-acyltransferase [Corynebacteriales bacterium]|nr:apolipoprotein N-acyltransferase [Mycobacteriales bacterium]
MSAPKPLLPTRYAIALGVLSGLAALLAFPRFNLWFTAPIAVAALCVATYGQRPRVAAAAGFGHGAGLFVPILHWTGLYVGAFPWLTLAAVQALYFLPLGMALAFTTHRIKRWLIPPAVATLWLLQEAIRGRAPFGGFPWAKLAFSQADAPTLNWASIGGAPLVSAIVAFVGGALFLALLYAPDKHCAFTTAATLGALGLMGVGALVPLDQPDGKQLTVAVVQGNVPRAGLEFNAQRQAVLNNHIQGTLDLAEEVRQGKHPQPDIVIWPENASDIDPLIDEQAGAMITNAAQMVKAPILVGAVLDGPGSRIRNAGIVWSPETGPGQTYIKQHPVPFAEYVPYRKQLRYITKKVDLVRRDFVPGTSSGVLRIGDARIGDVICFEVAYDGLVAQTVQEGAQLLVVQTNNATFGRSAESAQQLAMVRLRAVEHGRYSIMASTTGTSAIVNAEGEVEQSTPLFTARILTATVRLSDQSTIATRFGLWQEMLWCAGAVVVLGYAVWRRQIGR